MRSKLAKPSSSRSNGFFANSGKKSSNGIQAKLKANKPGDQYEVEADKTADHVVGQSMGSVLSSKSTSPGADFGKPLPVTIRPNVSSSAQRKEEEVQTKEAENESEELDVQMKESEIATMGMSDSDQGEEDPIRAQAIQMKEDDVQMKEDEVTEPGMSDKDLGEEDPIRAQAIQMKEDENVQLQEEDNESEEIQEKEEEVQMMEDDVQAKEDDDVQLQEDEDVQAKKFVNTPQPLTQPKRQSGSQTHIDQKLSDSKGGGSPLPDGVKLEMESGFGVDFTNVRIHTDTRAESMSHEIGAQAFTHKEDIYFNQNKFKPESKDGKLLLAHELTHTIQQGAIAPNKSEDNSKKDSEEDKQSSSSQSRTSSTTSKDTKSEAKPPIPFKEPVEGDKADEKAEGEEKEKETPTPENAESDPNFIELTGKIDKTAKEQTEHAPAGKLSNAAQEAAPSPPNERQSLAQAGQVEVMDEVAEEPKKFDKDGFKSKLMERIESMEIPENQEEADEFDENNNIAEVNKAATADVKSEQEKTTGPIDQTTNAEPNTSAVPERDVKDLKKPSKAPKPEKIDGAKATPPKRNESVVSKPLKDDASKMDRTMEENDVTDEQLAKSEEPKFENALESKNTAKENTKTAPNEFRAQEQSVLANTAAKSGAKGNEELDAMHAVRGMTNSKVLGDQKQTAKKDTSEREKIANDINKIYTNTKKDVDSILDKLETKVTGFFEKYSELAKEAFEDYVAKMMARYKARRYGGALGGARWLKDLFMGLPDEVNQFFVVGRKIFIKKMEEGIEKIAEYVAQELNRAKKRIQKGRNSVNEYVESLPQNLKHLGKEAAEDIQDKFSALDDDVNSREESLIDSLAQQYMATLEEVDERIEEMKAANQGLIDAALGFINGVIETIMKLKEMIVNLFSAIQSVIGIIMEDPIGFMKKLFDGIGKGIDAFKANIQKHMMGGLIAWLTGSLGPMGINIPDDIFSLKGIFSLVMQVLGLGWSYIRKKAVMMMGERMVNALTKGYKMFTTFAKKGIMGIWEYLKDQFTDLKETVIDAIKGMLITKVIKAGIKWLMSLLIPGAGFIKAIMAIKDLIVFFVESAMMLIPAITEAILALAVGSIAGVAKAIEKGLAGLIAMVINLFAKLIGLGGLSKKVMAIFKKIRKRVDRAVMKLLKKAKKAGRKLMAKLGIGSKEKPKNKEQHDEQVKAGLMYLHQQEKALDTDDDKSLSEDQAKKAAHKTKKKFVVFTSIVPKEVGGKWVYEWKGSTGTEKSKYKTSGAELPKYKLPSFSSSKASGFDAILTKNVPKGQESSAQKGPWPAWDAVRTGKADGTYVRTHLLHTDLGGKATISNLTPTKIGLNNRYYRAVEDHALKDIKKTNAIWYRVNLNYHSEEGYTDYISKINASYGEYEKKDGSWQYGKTLHKFTEDSPKPIFGDRVYNLNTDGATALSSTEGIDFNFADLVVRERKENGMFGSFGDFQERMNNRMTKGRVQITTFGDGMFEISKLVKKGKVIF